MCSHTFGAIGGVIWRSATAKKSIHCMTPSLCVLSESVSLHYIPVKMEFYQPFDSSNRRHRKQALFPGIPSNIVYAEYIV